MGMTPDELGDMEPREFMNKMLGFNDLETERRLWIAYVEACNNPYSKEKPGNFKDFMDKMTGRNINRIKFSSPDKFFQALGIK